MNIQNIRNILTQDLPDNVLEHFVIEEISKDPKIIPLLLELLHREREETKELLEDTNMELSRAFVHLLNPKQMKKDWVELTIRNHYLKWVDRIKICFKIKGLP